MKQVLQRCSILDKTHKMPECARRKNHGVSKTTSSRCYCTKCQLTAEHQQIVAIQVRIKKANRNGQINGYYSYKWLVAKTFNAYYGGPKETTQNGFKI